MLRSNRLLGSPPADRQSFGCSPAIEDVITQYPSDTRGFPTQRERQAPIIQLATERRDPRRARRQPGGETGQKGCDDILTLVRAVCTHRMGLGGSHWRLGNDGYRQRVYDAGNHLTGGRKRRSTYILAGPWAVGSGICRAACGGPPSLPFPKWRMSGPGRVSFFGSCYTLFPTH